MNNTAPQLTDDLLQGAKAIAEYMGQGWTERKVFNAFEQRSLPIHKVPGLGITARKSTLMAFFDNLDAPFTATSDKSGQQR